MTARVIAIVGMHRSGTSCLTGLLENAGLNLGAVSRWNPHNRKGNNENQAIVALHDAVLAANGGSWDAPPERCRWNPAQLEELEALTSARAHLGVWGFKDPRTLLVLEGWLEVVPGLEFVGSFRHPIAVARSLVARGGGDVSRYLELWWRYNLRLLQFQEKFGFDLVCFDDPSEIYRSRVAAAAKRLGLNPVQDALTFFDPKLRVQQGEEGIELPAHVKALYQTLVATALQ